MEKNEIQNNKRDLETKIREVIATRREQTASEQKSEEES